MNRIPIESSGVPTWPAILRLGTICTLAALLAATGFAQDKPGPADKPSVGEGGARPVRIAPITFDRAGTQVTLRQIGPAAWTDGTVKYREESRDAGKILLSNPDGELVRIELEKKTVVFLGANKGTYN
ncbi:MAG TPA: hypothetical protein VK968_19520, partial [Roseimicrobium sp.]|nr:hypothetical protein [Roseimicrobium sp.]